MYLDSQNQFSDAQAVTATAASTNLIDFGAERKLGNGEPLAAVITCDVAMAGTSPTLQVSIETDDNSGFSSAAIMGFSKSFTALAAGDKIVLPVPSGANTERYMRLKYTVGGTSPTVTLTAMLMPMNMIQNDAIYADGFNIQ